MSRIFYLYLFVFLMLLSFGAYSQTRVLAEKGVIDLRNWDFTSESMVPVSGEWEFYWQKLLEPSDFTSDNTRTDGLWIQVPGLWTGTEVDNQAIGNYGYATYRVKVLLPDNAPELGLRIHRLETAYKLWVDDQMVLENGKVGTSLETMKPLWKPTEVYFTPKNKEVTLTIQISNYRHRKAGLATPITIGNASVTSGNAKQGTGIESFIIGLVLIMGIYHFGIVALRPKEKSAMYFGLLCLSVVMHTASNGEILLIQIYPSFNWELLLKLNFWGNYARLVFFVLFIRTLFPEEVNRYFVRVIMWFTVAMFAVILVTPARIYTYTLGAYMAMVVIVIVYLIYGISLATIRKKEGAIYSLIGTVILLISALNDILYDSLVIDTMYLVPLGLFAFVFLQAFMLALMFSRSFNAVEVLTTRLLSLDKIKNEFLAYTSTRLDKPLNILAENVAAQSGLIVSYQSGAWIVEADTLMAEKTENINASVYFPATIFDYAAAERVNVVLGAPEINGLFEQDPYFHGKQVKSALCIPLFEMDALKGVLYLEHREETGVFTEERIKVLDLISSQITTLLDNNRIYRELENLNANLEEKVKQRTTEVYQQKEEIESQRDEIEKKSMALGDAFEVISRKNRDITDSIKYARRIQESIFPSDAVVKKLLPESFVLFRPKDLLSGDFYWIEQQFSADSIGAMKTEKIILAAVDCTGHGVPGALMSIIGSNLLNYAVNELKLTEPGAILNVLHEGVVNKLKQHDQKASRDGMDVALITYNRADGMLKFAGAENPMCLVRNGVMTVYKGDSMPIGGFLKGKQANHSFRTTKVQIKQGDMVFLYSDGYADQIGGTNRRKYLSRNFRELLVEVHQNPVEEQKKLLESRFDEWKEGYPQIDDVLVIGVQF